MTSPSLPLPSLLPRKSCRLCLRTVGGRPAPIAAGPAAPIPCALGRRDRPARLTSFLLPRFPSAAAFGFNEKRRLRGRQRPDNGGHEATKSASRSLWSLTCHPPLPCSVHPGAATAAPHPNRGLCMAHQGPAASPRGPPQAPHGKAQRARPPPRPSSAVLGGSFCSDRARVTRLCGMILGNKTAHFTRTGILPLFRRQRLVHGRHS